MNVKSKLPNYTILTSPNGLMGWFRREYEEKLLFSLTFRANLLKEVMRKPRNLLLGLPFLWFLPRCPPQSINLTYLQDKILINRTGP